MDNQTQEKEFVKIDLEDNQQDFLSIYCNNDGVILKTTPFQSDIWEGGIIPIDNDELFHVGVFCPIHKPPIIKFGYLNHKIEAITYL